MRQPPGYYLPTAYVGETVRAFVPNPLPPDPPIEWSASLLSLSQQAMLAIGRLDGLSVLMPDISQFVSVQLGREDTRGRSW